MQREWRIRILEVLEEALRVVATRRGSIPCRGCPEKRMDVPLLSHPEKEAIATLLVTRVKLQMDTHLRGHPNYQKACRVLEGLPLWSLDREIAMEVIDTLSSILGLPFRYENPTEEIGTSSDTSDIMRVMNKKIEDIKELLGMDLLKFTLNTGSVDSI